MPQDTKTGSPADVVGVLDTSAMDCVQANMALVADHLLGPGSHAGLGAPVRFMPRDRPGDLPTVEPTVTEHARVLRDFVGVDIAEPADGLCAATALEALHRGSRLLFVVADAHSLPWCPYFVRQHMSHTFVLTPHERLQDMVRVWDAYDNETPFGRARPGGWTMTPNEVSRILDGARPVRAGTVTVLPRHVAPDPGDVLRRNAEALTGTGTRAVEEYVSAYRDHPDRRRAAEALLLETWLLARSRRLHHTWLTTLPAGTAGAAGVRAQAEQADAWQEFAGRCYLAARRVRRGRPEPARLHERFAQLLTRDAELARRLAA
ncbi:hypothetical protein [Streptomyces sp. NPDC088812]|uniref:hypothetical protein n=1 Tax=Streptomyces sp. NPDC088812 TaxID=3365905 RepID=UPI003807C015